MYILTSIGQYEETSMVWLPWKGPDTMGDPTDLTWGVKDFLEGLKKVYFKALDWGACEHPHNPGDVYCSKCGRCLKDDERTGEDLSNWFVQEVSGLTLVRVDTYFGEGSETDWEPCDMAELYTDPGEVVLIYTLDYFLTKYVDNPGLSLTVTKENGVNLLSPP